MSIAYRRLYQSTAVISSALLLLLPLAYLRAQAADPLLNGGFEQAGTNANTAFDWQNFGRGYTRVQQPHSGQWSIRLQNNSSSQQAGAYQRIDLQQTSLEPVFIGGYVKGQNISSGSWLGASLYAEIHLNDGSVAYWNSIANNGTFSWRWIGFNTGTLASVNKPIDYIFVVPILGNASGTAFFDDIVVTANAPTQSAVTIMFDDGEDNTFTAAKPALDTRSLIGTSAVITGSVGNDDFMTWNQVKQLQSAGWEIVSHSVNHSDMTTLSPTRARNELTRSKTALQGQGLTVNNFAYPMGAYNGWLNAEAAKSYSSARAYELGDNPQGVYPFEVKVRSVINTTTPEQVAAWLEEAAAKKRWVVLTFHRIAAAGDDAFYTTPENLNKILDAVKASGLPVVTYNQGLNQFRSSPN